MEYEILIEANNFQGKLELYYLIEIQKESDWFPIAKSNTIKKHNLFELLKIPAHKFVSDESSRIRLRCFDVSKH